MAPWQALGSRIRMACLTGSASLLACGLLFGTVGCDPGWHYQATAGTPVQADGLRYDIPGTGNPKVRVYASAFTGSLDVELTLQNVDSGPLKLRSPNLWTSDVRGASLREQFPIRRSCPVVEDVMEIPAGHACTLAKTFRIQPLVSGLLLPHENPDLARISVKLTLDEPKPFPDVQVPMVWMK
jgi:hypothetical protein